ETMRWIIDEQFKTDDAMFAILIEEFNLGDNHIFPKNMIDAKKQKARMQSRSTIPASFGVDKAWVMNEEVTLELYENDDERDITTFICDTSFLFATPEQEEAALARCEALKKFKKTFPIDQLSGDLTNHLLRFLGPRDILLACMLNRKMNDFCKGARAMALFQATIAKYYPEYDPASFAGHEYEALRELARGYKLYRNGQVVGGFNSIREFGNILVSQALGDRIPMLQTGGNLYFLAPQEANIAIIQNDDEEERDPLELATHINFDSMSQVQIIAWNNDGIFVHRLDVTTFIPMKLFIEDEFTADNIIRLMLIWDIGDKQYIIFLTDTGDIYSQKYIPDAISEDPVLIAKDAVLLLETDRGKRQRGSHAFMYILSNGDIYICSYQTNSAKLSEGVTKKVSNIIRMNSGMDITAPLQPLKGIFGFVDAYHDVFVTNWHYAIFHLYDNEYNFAVTKINRFIGQRIKKVVYGFILYEDGTLVQGATGSKIVDTNVIDIACFDNRNYYVLKKT
ncbi:MAG: hypothetical protein ACMG6E_04110, partial [Candidatus Roizmanbacteria bacterium]